MASRSLISLLFLAILSACAAQSSFNAYHDARELLKRAKQLDPEHPFIPRAEVELEAGRTALNEARYSRATKSFRDVSRDAEKVIVSKDRAYSPKYIDMSRDSDARAAMLDLERRSAKVAEDEFTAPADVPEELPRAEGARMQLPAEALAKYLSQKKAKPEPAKPSKPSPKPAVKEEPKLPPPKVRATAPATTPIPVPSNPAAAKPEEKAERPEPEAAAVREAEPIADPQHNRRKLDPVLTFVPGEPGLLPGSKDELDRLSRFLLDNPSTTLVFKSSRALGEDAELSDQRFQNVRSYLEGKGVPGDQVQVDSGSDSATTPVFELFLIEH